MDRHEQDKTKGPTAQQKCIIKIGIQWMIQDVRQNNAQQNAGANDSHANWKTNQCLDNQQ